MRLISCSALAVSAALSCGGGSGNTAIGPSGGSGGVAGSSGNGSGGKGVGGSGSAGRAGSGSSSGGQSGAGGGAGEDTGGTPGAGSGNGGSGGADDPCGNGGPDPGEECDTGSVSATCDADCTFAVCGDGTVNDEAGEECDASGASADCDADCSYVICGDGRMHAAAGEECDDRGETATCDVDCTPPECGDGITNVAAGEECDDGNSSPDDGCSTNCEFEGAGSGGDTCATAFPITLGINLVTWTATFPRTYLTWRPTCSSNEPRDVDVVLSYTATFTGVLEVNLAKPDSLPWVAVVNDGPCGDTSAAVGCISHLPTNSMTERVPVVSGRTYYFYIARTHTDVTPLANPFTVTLTQVPAATGEHCGDPIWLGNGDNSVSWTASANNFFYNSPSCAEGAAIDGPDVVLFYAAAFTGYMRFEIEKPVSTRWVAMATGGEACGDLSSPLACVSSFTGTGLTGLLSVSASAFGQTGDNFRHILVADTSLGANPLANPLNVRITAMDEEGGTGETCNTTAKRITLGTNTVMWLGSVNDHLTAAPSCADGHAVTGADAVFEYIPPTSGNLTVTINKPGGARWVAVATDYQCGNVATPLTCMSDFSNTTMSGSFPVTAAFKYFLYVAATDEGTIPLYSPLTITLSQ